MDRLEAHKVSCGCPHFYNTEGEVDRVLELMSPERVSP
jgi:hypothetical protein